MTLSSCEVAYVATSCATYQALRIEMILKELKINEVLKIKLLVGNKSATDLASHPMSYDKNKHNKKKYHLLGG